MHLILLCLTFLLDVDECEQDLDNCHKMAFCNNTLDGFSCHCLPGYVGNGTSCEGILKNRMQEELSTL